MSRSKVRCERRVFRTKRVSHNHEGNDGRTLEQDQQLLQAGLALGLHGREAFKVRASRGGR